MVRTLPKKLDQFSTQQVLNMYNNYSVLVRRLLNLLHYVDPSSGLVEPLPKVLYFIHFLCISLMFINHPGTA